MTHGSLFSGIGGFDLAAEWMGWENLFHCEWNPFGQKVLNHYWPGAELFTDITKSDFKKYANKIDVLSGGFPCQPYSHAGKRLGKEDERHLWPEMLRAIREIRPTWVVGENVSGLISWNGGLVFHEVQIDLENEGYEVWPVVLPAASVGAPHRRDRVWFIAYSERSRIERRQGECRIQPKATRQPEQAETNSPHGKDWPTPNPTSDRRQWTGQGIEIKKGLQSGPEPAGQLAGGFEGLCNAGPTTNTSSAGQQERDIPTEPTGTGHSTRCNNEASPDTEPQGRKRTDWLQATIGLKHGAWDIWPTVEPTIRCKHDGLSPELDGITFSKWRNESIKAYGNAVVPQVVLQIFKAIEAYEQQQ